MEEAPPGRGLGQAADSEDPQPSGGGRKSPVLFFAQAGEVSDNVPIQAVLQFPAWHSRFRGNPDPCRQPIRPPESERAKASDSLDLRNSENI